MNLRKTGYFLLTAFVLASCGTTKPIAEKPVEKPTMQQTLLTEDQQNEFEYLFIEGLKQKKLGNVSNAASIFSRCLEIDPSSAVAMYELANIHYANKDLTSATLLLEKATSIDDSNKWYKLLLAQVYQQRKQFTEAAAIYEKLCKLEPENLEFLYSKAVLLGMAEKYQDAIEAYNQLEKEIGLSDQLSVAKQQLYMDWGKPEKAFEEIHRLIESNPEEPQYYGLLAELYQSQGDKENTLKYFNKILEIAPDNGFVHFSLAGYYQAEGDFSQAFAHIKLAFKNEELDAETKIQYYMMQTADPENSDWTDAQISEMLDILFEEYPDDNRMFTIYADYFIRQNKLVDARDYLRKYLETDPSSFVIWQQLMFLSNDLHDFETLFTDSKQAIELFPNQAVSYALNAVAALQLQKYEEALTVMEEGEPYILDNSMLKIQFEIYRAEAYYKLNQVEQAFKAFDEVIKLDPDNFMALNNYAYYLSLRGEDLDKAERLSNRVVQANPNNPTYLDTHAWVLFKRKDYSLAKFYIETALENGGDENAVLVEHYGDILYMLGDKEKALTNWEKALKLGDGSAVLEQKVKESRFIESNE
ncbi:MAG: tetratricopeptide repeat protein [Mangrovibacterium sp.]